MSPNDEWSEFLGTWHGRWLFIPIAIALVAILGAGLVLSLLGLDNLPKVAYSAPGAVALIMYYGIQVRKALRSLVAWGKEDRSAISGVSARIFDRNNTIVVRSGAPPDDREGPRGSR